MNTQQTIKKFRIEISRTALVVIDIQEKMIPAMPAQAAAAVLKNSAILIQGCRVFNLPLLLTEQYPKGLGRTHPDLQPLLEKVQPFEKLSFSSFRQAAFRLELERLHIRDILLCGIETHVCVLQTALDLLENDYRVFAAADTMCSRSPFNHQTGLQLMRTAGVIMGSTETFLFQMLEEAGTERFKQISKLVK